jgi:uncharacterized protein with PIN domain
MAVKVVDASALAALPFGEPEAEAVAERLSDARLVAPPLLGFELANLCLLKCRRLPDKEPALIEAFRLRTGLGVGEVAIDHEGAIELAAGTGLTASAPSW